MKRINIDDPAVDIDSGTGGLTYEGQPFNGEAVDISAEGVTITVATYVDGYEEGPHLEWHYDGTPSVEGVIKNHRPVGTWKRWHPNGRLAQVTEYSDKGDMLQRHNWDESGAPTENDTSTAAW